MIAVFAFPIEGLGTGTSHMQLTILQECKHKSFRISCSKFLNRHYHNEIFKFTDNTQFILAPNHAANCLKLIPPLEPLNRVDMGGSISDVSGIHDTSIFLVEGRSMYVRNFDNTSHIHTV
jgi:hypothetical protein